MEPEREKGEVRETEVRGRRGPTEDSVAILWRCVELLAVPRHPVVVFAVLLCPASVEGDEIYGRRVCVLLLAVSPRFPDDLLLSQAAAHSAEGRAEHDGEAEAQDAQEDPLEVEEQEMGVTGVEISEFCPNLSFNRTPDLVSCILTSCNFCLQQHDCPTRSYKSSRGAALRLRLSSQACSRGRLVSIQRMFSSMVS
ncbi:hypothetical protein EYF80_045168 [Liparis tanakae]|uniref:Uncharacterized protein n=1 Tax=Liparis tanakae TaxID=230148 RepID=A0A4Z2FUV5_9TELE|nr:hypothetical protein EYF80_045168 [Liparis tanakae]